jgi:hypothetical protein
MSGMCVACLPGTYKTTIGSGACTSCGMYSLAGASVCVNCDTGKKSSPLGDDCVDCPSGTFSRILSLSGMEYLSTCIDCTSGKYSGSGASLCLDCVPGTFSFNDRASVCTVCVAGKYSASNADRCSSCSANSYSLEASVSAQDCLCNNGYTGPAGGPCTRVTATTTQPVTTTLLQTTTSVTTTSTTEPTTTTPEPTKTTPEPTTTTPQPTTTTAESTTTTSTVTTTTPTMTTTPAPQQCNAGYTGPVGGPCIACPKGTYKNVNDTACVACRITGLTTIGLASTTVSQCVCDRGRRFFRLYQTSTIFLDFCITCNPGTYKDTEGNETSCKNCDETRTTELQGAMSETECICKPGYTLRDNTCVACEAGKYKDKPGNHLCSDCYQDSTSNPGASDCFCLDGSVKTDGTCTRCTRGTYWHRWTNEWGDTGVICLQCGAFATSAEGSSGYASCRCIVGDGVVGKQLWDYFLGYYFPLVCAPVPTCLAYQYLALAPTTTRVGAGPLWRWRLYTSWLACMSAARTGRCAGRRPHGEARWEATPTPRLYRNGSRSGGPCAMLRLPGPTRLRRQIRGKRVGNSREMDWEHG